MALDTAISLASVADVLSYLGEAPKVNAFWVYFSGSASDATAQVSSDTLILTHNGAADASLDLNNIAYDTIGELVAYINASVAGWDAGAICHASEDPDDLLETGALNALGEGNKQTLKIVPEYYFAELINRASDFINRYCGRTLKTTTYTNDQYYGMDSRDLFLEQYPISRIARVQTGRANSFSIINTSTDANFCTVEVSPTAIRLVVDGGANADDTSLTLSDYTSIDALITAIEVLAVGWDCTTQATDTSTRDADEILPRPAMYVDATTRAWIETGDSSLTDYWMIAPATGRNYGLVRRPGAWLSNTEYHVSYTAGYVTVPYALQMACIELVKYKYDLSKRGSGLKSEKIGNVYAYENFNIADLKNGLSPELVAELDLFRRRDF